jgi:hypothetical protein
LDLATAQTHLDAWLAADLAVAAGRSMQIDGRTLTWESADLIRAQIAYWQRQVDSLQGRQRSIKTATWTR